MRRAAKPSLPRRALSGHAAIGLMISALLYLVALTGTLAVAHDRWSRWEQPYVPEAQALTPQAVQAALVATAAATSVAPTTLSLQLPTENLPRAIVSSDEASRYVDDSGRLGPRKDDRWTEFIIALHETLTLPAIVGRSLVGALGVALGAVTLTGVFAHPRILRDAFCLRSRHAAAIARVDWHNRLGVWTLPFVLAVATTGAVIGLGEVANAMMARMETRGDSSAIYAAVFGRGPAAPGVGNKPIADAAAALRTLRVRMPLAKPTYVILRNPAREGQDIQIVAEHPKRLIFGETYLFDAAGRWIGPVGLAAGAIGQQVAASDYNLHFGNYGGPVVEIAYVLLGLSLCGVIATGTAIWLEKRAIRGCGSLRLTACWRVVVWSTPASLLLCLWATVAGDAVPLAPLFWSGLALGILLAIWQSNGVKAFPIKTALAAAAAATAIAHLAIVGPQDAGSILIDLTGIAAGLTALLIWRRRIDAGAGHDPA